MKRIVTGLLLGSAAAAVCLHARQAPLSLTCLTCRSPRLPAAFDGYKILLASDLHGQEFGARQSRLLSLTRSASPDCIVMTGDMIHDERSHISAVTNYVRPAVKIAPVYFTPGNHEYRCGVYSRLRSRMEAAGATPLEDSSVLLERNGERIALIGLRDPDFWVDSFLRKRRTGFYRNFHALLHETEGMYRVVLCHRPELFPNYVRGGVDLALTGHAHGGQFRLPFGGFGGLIAPDQGFFPAYTEGLYQKGSSAMVVSRGLGNCMPIPRICNRPELVLCTLRSIRSAC